MRLYEIQAEIEDVLNRMVDPETGEVSDDALVLLEDLSIQRNDKIENVALYFKNLSADAAAIKAEEETLRKRRQSAENHAARLKYFLSNFMPGETLETAKVKIGWRNTPSVQIQDEAQFIEWASNGHDELLSFKAPTVNKTAVSEAIKAGLQVSVLTQSARCTMACRD